MIKRSINGRCYIIDEHLEETGYIRHGFTTIKGGYSTGKIQGLNLGFRVGDRIESVMKNYKAVSGDLGLSISNMVLAKQTHTDNVRVVTAEDKGKGLTKESDIEDTDGLITNEKNIPLVVFSADCIPVLLADKHGRAIGAVHAGWRGTVMKIPQKAVSLMAENYGIKPRDIVVSIGPGIGKCCFEVGEEVAKEFAPSFVKKGENGKFYVDLWEANASALMEIGVLKKNISIAKICTKCNDDFYSYRRMGDKTGRMGALIELK